MRALLIAGALALLAGPALAQEAVEIPFAPGVGSSWRVNEVRTRSSSGEGAAETRTTTSNGTLGFRTASDSGYDATWMVNTVESQGIVVANEPSYFIGLPMSLTLDETGAPTAIEDWDGLRGRIVAVFTETTPANERDESWRRSTALFENLLASWTPAHAAQMMVPTVAVLSICQHTGLALGQPLTSQAQMPNALGGPPITANISFELQQVDRAAGLARVLYTSALDPASATASIGETLERLTREGGGDVAELRRQFQGLTLTHDTRAECVVDLNTGVTRAVHHEVRIAFGPAIRTDRREINVERAS